MSVFFSQIGILQRVLHSFKPLLGLILSYRTRPQEDSATFEVCCVFTSFSFLVNTESKAKAVCNADHEAQAGSQEVGQVQDIKVSSYANLLNALKLVSLIYFAEIWRFLDAVTERVANGYLGSVMQVYDSSQRQLRVDRQLMRFSTFISALVSGGPTALIYGFIS